MPKRTKDHTSQQGAAGELLKRRGIRNSLSEWARYRGFEPAPHHQLFIREIEAFLESNDEVLLLFAPPGSAKSTYVSVLLPSWYLANHPTHSILAATHNVEFAERWGRRVRNDIAADSRVLGISLSEDSKAAARWSLASGGEYYGVGAGVGISGFRANLGVGDDATKRLANGTIKHYWYAWRGGALLRGEPGMPEFVASYNEAVARKVTAQKACYPQLSGSSRLAQSSRGSHLGRETITASSLS